MSLRTLWRAWRKNAERIVDIEDCIVPPRQIYAGTLEALRRRAAARRLVADQLRASAARVSSGGNHASTPHE